MSVQMARNRSIRGILAAKTFILQSIADKSQVYLCHNDFLLPPRVQLWIVLKDVEVLQLLLVYGVELSLDGFGTGDTSQVHEEGDVEAGGNDKRVSGGGEFSLFYFHENIFFSCEKFQFIEIPAVWELVRVY